MNFIFTLEEVGLRDAPQVGEEAAALGEILRIGAPVPAAFIIPTTAYAEYLNYPGVKTILSNCETVSSEELKAQLLGIPLPPVLERSLRSSYRNLSGPRDTFVSVRAGDSEQEAMGEEELIQAVKKLWAEHLIRLCSLEKSFSLNPLPILVQQVERKDLEGRLFTSDPYSSNSGITAIEVDHPSGKEKFFLEKGADRLTKRIVTGVVEEETPFETVSSLSSWATKIEKLLGSPQELAWSAYHGALISEAKLRKEGSRSPSQREEVLILSGARNKVPKRQREALTFSSVKPLYLRRRVPAAAKLWVQVDSAKEPIPDEAEGAITTTAESAVSLAERFPAKPVLLALGTINEEELAIVRRARHTRRQRNLHLVLPPVRTVDGLREIKREIAGEGLPRGPNLKFYFRASYPANIVLLDQFLELEVDGVIFDTESLTQGFLGTKEVVEPDDSLLWAVVRAREECQKAGVELLYLANTVSEEFLGDLIREGVNRIAVPAAEEETLLPILATIEERMLATR